MPHLTLEYTANVTQDVDFDALFARLHQILADIVGIRIDDCKSRAIRLEDYYIGRGGRDHAFVHLNLRFLEGRTPALKQETGQHMMAVLQKAYSPSTTNLDLQISIEITDIQRTAYFKFPTGSLPV